jgi:predicted acylesterase/phospholipase RssA
VLLNNNYYVDGALVNNFPINYCPKNKTFGIYTNNSNGFEINSIQSILTACTNVVSNIISQKNLNSKYKNIIKIVYPDQTFSILDITKEDKKNLIEFGYKTACEVLNQDI